MRHLLSKLKSYCFELSRSIKYRFAASIALILLLPATGVIFVYQNTSRMIKNDVDNFLKESIKEVSRSIETKLDIVDNSSMLFLSNPTIRYILENSSTFNTEYLQVQKRLEMDEQLKYLLFFNYAWDRKLLKSIFIFQNRETYYYILRPPISTNIIRENLKVYDFLNDVKAEKYMISPSEEDATVYYIRNYYNLNTLELIGKLVLGINESALQPDSSSLIRYRGIQAFTVDSSGVVISHTNGDMVGKKAEKIDSTTYISAEMNIEKYRLTSFIAVPKSEVYSKLTKSVSKFLQINIAIACLMLVLGSFVLTATVRYFNDLIRVILQVKNGNFDSRMPNYKYIELKQLSEVFNKMTNEIKRLIREVYEKQLLLRESELKSLQAQINPHFLFNTLEVISWQARMAKNDMVYDMIISLGQLIRANIYFSSKEKITIREEFQYIEFYLFLQKARFGDRMETEININESILDFFLPKLCIQPIVENAVVHGLENKRGKGRLSIYSSVIDDAIIFTVEDDGIGFNIESFTLDKPLNKPYDKTSHSNIGLYNVNRRVKLMYGDDFGLSIASSVNSGTTVKACIPKDKKGDIYVQSNDSR